MPKLNVENISRHTGVPAPTLYRLFAQEVLPDSKSLAEVTKAIIAHYKKVAFTKSARSNDPLTDEKIRLTRAQADKLEVDNQIAAGELLKVQDVEKEWTNHVLACRSRLLAIPVKLALELSQIADPVIIERKLKTEIHQALQELSEISQNDVIDSEDFSEVETATDSIN